MALFRETMMVVLVVMMAAAGSTTAVVYNVGDSVGWTFDQNYDQWVSSKKIQVGDTLGKIFVFLFILFLFFI